MSGARTYLLLLLGIASLVGTSGGLGYYFFAILPNQAREVAPPEAAVLAALHEGDTRAAATGDQPDPDGPAKAGPRLSRDTPAAWSIGPRRCAPVLAGGERTRW